SALGIHEVDEAVARETAFEATECRSAVRLALQVRPRAPAAHSDRRVLALRNGPLGRRIRIADAYPLDEQLVAGARRSEIRIVDPAHFEHLQPSAVLERAETSRAVGRSEAIKTGRTVVLGQVDEPRHGIDRGSFVLHPA